MSATKSGTEWHKTACILCECNCGIEVRLGGEDGRRFERRPVKKPPTQRRIHLGAEISDFLMQI